MNKLNKIVLFSAYLIVILFIFAAADVFLLNNRLNLGHPRFRDSSKAEYPYAGFIERSLLYNLNENRSYFSFKNNADKIRIAFFGGSTAVYPDF